MTELESQRDNQEVWNQRTLKNDINNPKKVTIVLIIYLPNKIETVVICNQSPVIGCFQKTHLKND